MNLISKRFPHGCTLLLNDFYCNQSTPANSAVDVMIGCAARLVDITPAARVPAAIVGRATRPAVPTREVMTVLPAIVMAGTEKHNTKYY